MENTAFSIYNSREDILKNLKLIIRIRFIISPSIFLLMLAAGLIGATKSGGMTMNQILVNGINMGTIMILNVIYQILLRKLENLRPLVYFQLFIDVIHFALTIYKTGGAASPFAFLYFFVIISASFFLNWKGTLFVASAAALLYTLDIVLEAVGILPHQDFMRNFSDLRSNVPYLTMSWAFTVLSYLGFSGLASYLNGMVGKKMDILYLMFRTSKALNSYKSIKDLVDYILRELVDFLKLDRALLYLAKNQESLELYQVKFADHIPLEKHSLPNVSIPLSEDAGLTAKVALEQQAYNIQDPGNSDLINKELAKTIGLNPFAVAPLVLRGETIGVIGIDRSGVDGEISEEEFRILQMFANQAAITLGSLQNKE